MSDHRWNGHHPGIIVLSSPFFPCCHLLCKSFALLNRGLCVNSTSSSYLPVTLPLIQVILGLESMKIHKKFYVTNHWLPLNDTEVATQYTTCIAFGRGSYISRRTCRSLQCIAVKDKAEDSSVHLSSLSLPLPFLSYLLYSACHIIFKVWVKAHASHCHCNSPVSRSQYRTLTARYNCPAW